MNHVLHTAVALLAALFFTTASAAAELDAKARKQGMEAWKRGAEFLIKSQNRDGSWSRARMPGITALCIMALHEAPVDVKARDAAIEKGVKSILSFARENGSIAPAAKGERGAYPTYNTALALLALGELKKPEHAKVLQAARRWLKAQQVLQKDAASYGGFGYGEGRGGRADLSNTALALEALYYTEYLDREPFVKEGDVKRLTEQNKKMWKDLETFLETCHNREKKDDDSSSKALRNGSFSYIPGKLMTSTSMTYAGLKSMLYAKLERNDPRVKITWSFVQTNYAVDQNPGQGQNGFYSYMHNLAKALAAYGRDTIKLESGETADWRADLVKELAGRQKDDGSWQNAKGRFMESVPELASSYAMISIRHALAE